jgi:predicted nucleic acid-binding protein
VERSNPTVEYSAVVVQASKEREQIAMPKESEDPQQPPPVILIDTCVWLELAKDYNQRSLVKALETLIGRHELELAVPRIVVEELARNKTRIVEDSGRILTAALKRAREAINTFGDLRRKKAALREMHEVDIKLLNLGDEAAEMLVDRI